LNFTFLLLLLFALFFFFRFLSGPIGGQLPVIEGDKMAADIGGNQIFPGEKTLFSQLFCEKKITSVSWSRGRLV
jgi:hypothetical protein